MQVIDPRGRVSEQPIKRGVASQTERPVDDSISPESLLNAAGHPTFTNLQNANYRSSARSKQISDGPSALGNSDRWRIELHMFVGMVRRPLRKRQRK